MSAWSWPRSARADLAGKHETATRLRGRIEAILDWAAVRGHRKGDNPARWRGHLQKALPTIKKSLRVRHHPALPFKDMPDFMAKLARQVGVSARALAFCILTATRTSEMIHARWGEIDLDRRAWIIPATRMKIPREHRVALSAPAAVVLKALKASLARAPGRPNSPFPAAARISRCRTWRSW